MKTRFRTASERIDRKDARLLRGCAYLHFDSSSKKAIHTSCMVICFEFSLLLLPFPSTQHLKNVGYSQQSEDKQ